MRIDKILMALLVFMVIMTTLFFTMFGTSESGDDSLLGLKNKYNLNMTNSSLDSDYMDMRRVFNMSDRNRETILQEEIEENTGWENFVTGTVRTFRYVGSSFGAIGLIAVKLSEDLNIPIFWIDFMMIAVSISVIFGLVYLVMRFKPSNK